MCKLLGCANVCGLIHRMCRVIAEVGEIVKSFSIVVIGKVSVINSIFLNISVLFVNFFTLVCYGFKLLNHISRKQWFQSIKPYFKQAMVLNC